MKKITCTFLFFISCFTNAYALSVDELPNDMLLTQHWISYTTSFDIETKTRKIGSLYRRLFSIPLKYDFYDDKNNLLTTARLRFFSITAHLDVFDANKSPLGAVKEKIFTFLPCFTIYAPDGEKLAHAEFNFWGTQVTVSDARTDTPIAIMSRPFFRIKNDWAIKLKHKVLLTERNIDPSLLLTVLAFQSDREYWEQQEQNNNNNSNPRNYAAQQHEVKSTHKEKITAISHQYEGELHDVELLQQPELEALTLSLEQAYQAQVNPALSSSSAHARVDAFVTFCLDLIHSENTTNSTKKAMLYLLEQRFNGLD